MLMTREQAAKHFPLYVAEMKRRARMAVEQAKEAREMGDRFTCAFQLNYAARCRLAAFNVEL